MEGYPYVTEIEVRFRDLDPLGHVNNAVYASYLEQARVGYYEEVVGVGVDEISFVLANLEIEYNRAIEHGEEVRIGVRTSDIGDKSMTTEFRVEADGELAAVAETVQVAVDEQGGSTELPDGWRHAVEEHEESQ